MQIQPSNGICVDVMCGLCLEMKASISEHWALNKQKMEISKRWGNKLNHNFCTSENTGLITKWNQPSNVECPITCQNEDAIYKYHGSLL